MPPLVSVSVRYISNPKTLGCLSLLVPALLGFAAVLSFSHGKKKINKIKPPRGTQQPKKSCQGSARKLAATREGRGRGGEGG